MAEKRPFDPGQRFYFREGLSPVVTPYMADKVTAKSITARKVWVDGRLFESETLSLEKGRVYPDTAEVQKCIAAIEKQAKRLGKLLAELDTYAVALSDREEGKSDADNLGRV